MLACGSGGCYATFITSHLLPEMKNFLCLRFILLGVLITPQAYPQPAYPLPPKKIIEFGWHSPLLADLRTDLAKYESGPFDGLSIKLPASVGGGNIFMVDDL